jgi:soluble lytic murein transglycosylase-like protein/TolA-binding protein
MSAQRFRGIVAGALAILTIAALTIATWTRARAHGPQTSPAQAFVGGYQFFALGDLRQALPLLQAAGTPPEIADYALFYLGQTQFGLHDFDGAQASFRHLTDNYANSLLRPQAVVMLAKIALIKNQYELARQQALLGLALSDQTGLRAEARLVLGRALIGLGQLRDGYLQLQTLRQESPRAAADAPARASAAALLLAHPELAAPRTPDNLAAQAELLLSEGQSGQALERAHQALDMAPPPPERDAMLWVIVRALRGNAERQEPALQDYLAQAPNGVQAPAALEQLALIVWHRDDTTTARIYFGRLIDRYPHSALAPGAMLRMGRTYEDDNQLEQARALYRRLLERYPDSSVASTARFRAAWMLYLGQHFSQAADEFGADRNRAADDPRQGDRYAYWQARALAQSGHSARARAMLEILAASLQTNYYPELARQRLRASFPAIEPVEFTSPPAPAQTQSARWRYHLARARALSALALYQLAAGELRYMGELSRDNHQAQLYLLGQFQGAQDYYDALVTASRMAKLGVLADDQAQPLRYPRAYWSLFSQAAAHQHLPLLLLLALSRQESLFNPQARSSADARGLMQLMPATAARMAAQLGMSLNLAELFNPQINIELGSAKLRQLSDLFDGDLFKTVAAYNAGEDAVQRWVARFNRPDDEWVENIDYNETRNYVKQVVGGMRQYRMLYGALKP